MDEFFSRVAHNLLGRLDGPLHFRFILQPLMSLLFAIRDGVHDAREGRPAYLWSIFTDSETRHAQLHYGWKAVSRIFLLGLAMDFAYQVVEFRWFYPGEAVITAALLAMVPYALLRGPVNRLARHFMDARRLSHPAH